MSDTRKPLELQIYPLLPEVGQRGRPGYIVGRRHVEQSWVTEMSERKRLTDAELAAEFESARCDYLLSRDTGTYWAPLGETWPNDHASAGRRASTLLRFASSEHYDEEQA